MDIRSMLARIPKMGRFWIAVVAAVAIVGLAIATMSHNQQTVVDQRMDSLTAGAPVAQQDVMHAGPMGGSGFGGAPAFKSGPVDESESEPPVVSEASLSDPGPPDLSAMSRRIIYNAQVDLVVNDLSRAQEDLDSLVRVHGGFLSQTSITGSPGSPRDGEWTIRVPSSQFEDVLTKIQRIGELQNLHVDSQDVTQDYYDLTAHIGNKQVEEQRLLQLLGHTTAHLSDILEVERDISSVRGDIEQLQGRQRMLADLSDLCSITVNVTELKGYIPPQSPTFPTQISRTFAGSLSALGDTAKVVVLTVVAAIPWALVALVFALPIAVTFRRFRHGRSLPREV